MKNNQTVKIKSNEENPEPIEIIAQSVIEIAQAFKKIEASKLSRRAIVLLINDKCSCGISAINEVLDVIPKLEKFYIKDLPKTK